MNINKSLLTRLNSSKGYNKEWQNRGSKGLTFSCTTQHIRSRGGRYTCSEDSIPQHFPWNLPQKKRRKTRLVKYRKPRNKKKTRGWTLRASGIFIPTSPPRPPVQRVTLYLTMIWICFLPFVSSPGEGTGNGNRSTHKRTEASNVHFFA